MSGMTKRLIGQVYRRPDFGLHFYGVFAHGITVKALRAGRLVIAKLVHNKTMV
jgi:hypothetical protein